MIDFQIKGKTISNTEVLFLLKQGLKWCNKCKRVHQLDAFANKKGSLTGKDAYCKECNKRTRLDNIDVRKEKDRQYYLANRESVIARAAKYRAENPDKIIELRRSYYSENKDAILSKNKEYLEQNKDVVYAKQRERNQSNKSHRTTLNKAWRNANRDRYNQYKRDRYSDNIEYKMRCVCRQLVRRMFLSINSKKTSSTNKVLGYSPLQLKEHIELLFKPGMTWDNYGEWHIDHIKPISSATSLYEGIRLSQLENLQPLWAEENLVKGNKII